jgi:hypothetical protein
MCGRTSTYAVAGREIFSSLLPLALISLLVVVVVWGWPLALTGMGASPLVYSLDIVE